MYRPERQQSCNSSVGALTWHKGGIRSGGRLKVGSESVLGYVSGWAFVGTNRAKLREGQMAQRAQKIFLV